MKAREILTKLARAAQSDMYDSDIDKALKELEALMKKKKLCLNREKISREVVKWERRMNNKGYQLRDILDLDDLIGSLCNAASEIIEEVK